MRYMPLMSLIIAKVSTGKGNFRVVIPRALIKNKGWEKVEHVIIEDHHPGHFIIKRLFEDEENER